jgi:hypothetical protein
MIPRVALCAILFCVEAWAQISETRLEGTIRTSSGALVSGASITVVESQTGWRAQTKSNGKGRFEFLTLPPGTYTVTVGAKGFTSAIHTNVLVGSSNFVEERFSLTTDQGEAATEEASRKERIGNLQSETSGVLTSDDLAILPQMDQDPVALAPFQPGVQMQGGQLGLSGVNGSLQGSNNVSLDGLGINDPVDPSLGSRLIARDTNTIAQMRVITSGGAAEFGRNAGAQVLLTTRSGGSRWSGNGFEYAQNKALNARNYFDGAEKLPFYQSLFGVSLGGPILKDRTFVFANYQGKRASDRIVRNCTVLTEDARSGIFTWTPPGKSTTSTFDIVENDPRHLGIDPQVAKVMALLPEQNNTDIGDGVNTAGYRFNNILDSKEDQATIRLDHELNRNNRLFVRGSWLQSQAVDIQDEADARYPDLPSGLNLIRSLDFVAGSDWSIRANLANQFRVGYMNAKVSQTRSFLVGGATGTISQTPPSLTLQPLLVNSSWTDPTDPSFPKWSSFPTMEFEDNLIYIRGNHVFKAGGGLRHIVLKNQTAEGIYPIVTFGIGEDYGNIPSTIGPSGRNISTTDREKFEKLYNDLLGRMETVTQTFYSDLQTYLPSGTARAREFSANEFYGFVQDEWKLLPNLTVNLGIRYEFNGAPSERNGIQAAIGQTGEITSTANIDNLAFQRGGNLYKGENTNFAPRVGFAWRPGKSTRTVVRGGFGIYYDRLVNTAVGFVDSHTPGSSQVVAIYPNLNGTDVRLSDGIPVLSKPGDVSLTFPATRSTSAAIFKADLRTPYVKQFSLIAQRELFRNFVVQGGYVGVRGEKLFSNLNLNQVKISGDFLAAFRELQQFRSNGVPVSASNTLAKMFGSVNAAITAIGGSNLDQGLAGLAAAALDQKYFSKYSAAGISDFYIRNYPQFDQFLAGSNDGKSSYDSFQGGIRLDTSVIKASVNYTWSKSLDNIAAVGNSYINPIDSFHPEANKAPSDLDRKRVLNSWLVLSLPIGKGRFIGSDASGWVGQLISDWNMSLMTVWETGGRFSASSGLETFASGVDSLANYSGSRNIGAINRGDGKIYWFTTGEINAFSFPSAGETGTSGRNSFVGPGYIGMDAALAKDFRLGNESRRIRLRAEAYNVFNNANFGLPNNNLSDPDNFGRITSMAGPSRRLQVGVQFEF